MVIAAFILCSKMAFSDVLEGVALENFLGASRQTPIILPSSSKIVLCCEMPKGACVLSFSVALGVVVAVAYFILSWLLYLAFSANLGLLCMPYPGMGPLV